jgi:sigma-B regulation protein RsbU (phosphoserine phosphatase)
MLLRTRITLMVSISTVVLTLVVLAEGRVREQRAIERYETTQIAGDRNAWFGVQESISERLSAIANEIQNDDRTTRAVADHDVPAIAQAMAETIHHMQTARIPIQAEIFAPDGTMTFTTTGQKNALIASDLVVEAVRRGTLMRGLARVRQGLVVAVVSPFYARTGVSGVLAVYSDANALVGDIAGITGAKIYLIGADGRPLGAPSEGSKDSSWAAATGLAPGQAEGVANRSFGHQVFLTDWFALNDAIERPVGRLIAVRDVTAGYRRAELISLISRGGMLSGGALFLAFLYWYMRNAFSPLNAVIRVLNALSRGDTHVPHVDGGTGRDEIGRLAGTLENFRQAQQARDQLARIRQDIDAASRIQNSILPRNFPSTERYRLQAIMRPAQNVGGDFYDFFDLPDGRLGFVIADVSGKGMGAAMFMAMARTVIRSVALVAEGPGECLTRANDLLCANNSDGSTFVTVFYGILDPATGAMVFANGGHNPPYRLGRGGAVEAVPGTGGLALGIMEGFAYADGTAALERGDHLVLYTDGVTEAMDAAGEQFTEERLEKTLGAVTRPDAASIIEAVVRAVDEFAGETPQADDITCLTLDFI